MIRGVSGQPIGAQIRDASTGAAFAGVVTVYIKGDLTAQVTGSVGGGLAASDGHGYFEYIPSAGETDFNHIAYTFDGPGAVGQTIQIETISPAQVQALQTATGLASVAAAVIVTDALFEIRVARAGDVVNPDLMDFGIGKLNRLLDRWNAHPRARYVVGFQSFTPIPTHQPHTLGPNSADWAVTQRPVKIRSAHLILNTGTPAIRLPITVRDRAWWSALPVQGLATTIPTDLYFQPDWPNGSVFLWPVPTSTYPIELELDGLFGVLTATDTFWLPFGYRDAITLTLAEELAPGTGQTASQSTRDSARAARALIFAANDEVPNLVTRDGGVPGGPNRTQFNFRTGQVG